MTDSPILCRTCCHWVDCGEKDGEPHGFCVMRDLYTYTAYTQCAEYLEGELIDESEMF